MLIQPFVAWLSLVQSSLLSCHSCHNSSQSFKSQLRSTLIIVFTPGGFFCRLCCCLCCSNTCLFGFLFVSKSHIFSSLLSPTLQSPAFLLVLATCFHLASLLFSLSYASCHLYFFFSLASCHLLSCFFLASLLSLYLLPPAFLFASRSPGFVFVFRVTCFVLS